MVPRSSVRVVDLFPEFNDGSDVSDFLRDDTSGAKLAALARKQPTWEPGERDKEDTGETKKSDEEILCELAALSPIAYGRRRKEAAKQLGVSVTVLDKEVERRRPKGEKKNFLPHWDVEPWDEEVDGDALLDELRKHLRRYIVLPPHADAALSLWVLQTWVFDVFDLSPYLAITSPTRRCGKTVLMTLLYWLCARGKKSDSMSKAAIYRSVDAEKPTLVLDEVGWVVDHRDERQNILCGGFERNGYAEVCEGEGSAITTHLYSTYCPKAFGLIGKLTATLMDRAIEIPMQRKKSGEQAERMRRRDNTDHKNLRRQCLRWAQDNPAALETSSPGLPEGLNDRALDCWEPLFTVAARLRVAAGPSSP
jgi:putative DNA primase/helicase